LCYTNECGYDIFVCKKYSDIQPNIENRIKKNQMKEITLKSKNLLAKVALTLLGFALSTNQCLAQYMAIMPRSHKVQGRLTGISDTISNFKIIINRDTLNASWKDNYEFNYKFSYLDGYSQSELNIRVPEDAKYQPVNKIIAIKPDEDEIEIEFEEKE